MKKTRTANLHHLYHEPLPENLKLTPKVEVDNVHQRQTTDVYEHALTITAWQQIYDQLHPGKFHGEFTEILLDDIQVFVNTLVWRCVSRAWSGRTRSGLAFRRRAVSRDLSVRNVWEAQKLRRARVEPSLN